MSTQPWQIQQAYQRALAGYIGRLKKECRENYVDYVLLDTSTTYDVALIEYLMKRSKIQ
jgi:hypothetical protein